MQNERFSNSILDFYRNLFFIIQFLNDNSNAVLEKLYQVVEKLLLNVFYKHNIRGFILYFVVVKFVL